jgi:hypothetical protein
MEAKMAAGTAFGKRGLDELIKKKHEVRRQIFAVWAALCGALHGELRKGVYGLW